MLNPIEIKSPAAPVSASLYWSDCQGQWYAYLYAAHMSLETLDLGPDKASALATVQAEVEHLAVKFNQVRVSTPTTVQVLKDWCVAHYDQGADTMVECWDTDNYVALILQEHTLDACIEALKTMAGIYAERQADAAYHRQS